jgi:serine/threonine-protein kinase
VSLDLGSVIQNKYRIIRLIGQGGMGAVYEGENILIARRVAIKVLYAAVASQHGVVERFEREAQAAGRIGNDHILEVLDMGTLHDGNRFMVMEFLDGETLGERTTRVGRLSAQQIAPLARQLLVGLAAAHHAGIIHRDLKPDNVFILREKAGQPDFVKIIDFGISKFTTLDQDMKMTATGAVMGTPYFMSPEQAKGSRISDVRSDLYAVGVIIYKTITGLVPFDGATFNELLFKIVLSPVPQPRESVPELDPGFESIVMKAMARDPEFRFQTAEAFIAALDAWMRSGAGVTVPPPEASGYNMPQVIGPHTPTGTHLGNRPATMATEGKSTWSQAQSTPEGSSSSARWVAVGAVAAVLALGGGAFAFFGNRSAASTGNAAGGASTDLSVNPSPSTIPTPDLGQPNVPKGPEVKPVTDDEHLTGTSASTAASDTTGTAPSASGSATEPVSSAPANPKGDAVKGAVGSGRSGHNTVKPPQPDPLPPAPPPSRPRQKPPDSPDFGY